MATHCSILAWRIPCTAKPGGLQSMGGYTELDTTDRLGTHTRDLIMSILYLTALLQKSSPARSSRQHNRGRTEISHPQRPETKAECNQRRDS